MRAAIIGATGMIGQGVLRECLRDPDIESVVSIVRKATGITDARLREIVLENFHDFIRIEPSLRNLDACFFTLGVTSAGMSDEEYRRVTYDITIAAANAILRASPQLTFCFVSGAGTDSSERGRTMWARVKGAAENALLKMPFKAAYMFRPAMIRPMHGIKSKTKSYRVLYSLMTPVLPLLVRLFPRYVTTTEVLGRAMIEAAKHGAPKTILESDDINQLGR